MIQNWKASAKSLIFRKTQRMIEKEVQAWPPWCAGPLYQPQRPAAIPQSNNKNHK